MDIADLVKQSQAVKIPAYLQSTADLRNTAVAQNEASEASEQHVWLFCSLATTEQAQLQLYLHCK